MVKIWPGSVLASRLHRILADGKVDDEERDQLRALLQLAKSNITPLELLNTGTSWATSFERDRIVEALRAAHNRY